MNELLHRLYLLAWCEGKKYGGRFIPDKWFDDYERSITEYVLATNKLQVYVVKQTQPSEDYHDYTIAVFLDRDRALRLARDLNQEYGKGCVFNNDWDFVELDTCEDLHYYTIEGLNLNPDTKNFF